MTRLSCKINKYLFTDTQWEDVIVQRVNTKSDELYFILVFGLCGVDEVLFAVRGTERGGERSGLCV